MLVMTIIRDVVYNKATDDFTVSVKDLKRDIVMDGERLVKTISCTHHKSSGQKSENPP